MAAALEKARAAALERMRAGRFAEATAYAEQALKLTEALHGRDAVETGVAAHNLGFLLRRADRTAEAQQNFERALAIYERTTPAVHEDTGNLLGELGQIYMTAGRGKDVALLYQGLIDRAGREGYGAHIGVAHMHNNLAFVLRGLKREDESVAHWRAAIAIYSAQSLLGDENYRLAVESLLDSYQRQGKADQAETLIADMLAKQQAGGNGDDTFAAGLLDRLSALELAAGRFAEARDRAAAALTITERWPSKTATEAMSPLNNLARAERALGNYAAAETNYKRAIALLDKAGDTANAGILSDNLAVLYRETERFDEAEIQHKRALQLLEKALGREHREVGAAAANFGAMLTEAGRYAEAEPLLRRGLAIAEAQSPQDPVSIGIIVDNLAGALRQSGRGVEALPYQQRAMSLFEGVLPPEHPTLATARNNLGRLLLDLGRYAEAEIQLRRSLDISERLYGADHLNVAVAAANLGEVYAAMGQREKGRELLRRALAGLERSFGANHTSLLQTLFGLGRLEMADGHAQQALVIFERAVAIQLAARNRLGAKARNGGDEKTDDPRAFYGLLDTLWETGGEKDAVAVAHALEISQWNATPAAMALTALGARAGAGDPALGALTRERQDLAADWQATDKSLTRLLSESGERNIAREQALRERLAASETRLATIDQALQAKFPRYDDLAKPVPLGLAELRGLLRPNEAALHYVVTPEATHLWLVSKTETRWVRINAGWSALSSLVDALRCGLDREAWDGDGRKRCARLLDLPEQTRLRQRDALPFQLERAQALFATLLGPVREAIAGKDLLIVASGPLTALPFHALVTEKPNAPKAGGEGPDFAHAAWLGRSNAVTMLPSLASLKSLRQFAKVSRAASPFIGIGNPLLTGQDGVDRSAWSRQTCDAPAMTQRVAEIASSTLVRMVRGGIGEVESLRRQPPLPETADELCTVAKYVGAAPDAVLLGGNATEARIKALSVSGKLADARVLHLATHGLLADETKLFLGSRAEPSLMLTPPETPSDEDDGLLTASEVATLKLDADWVILSACNTASGDRLGGEALSGLARAFFYAGARSLLVSHWAVHSDATVNLITGSFAAMGETPGMTQAEALRHAMLTLIDGGGREAHPSYWAPFIVVGSSGASSPPAVQATVSASIIKATASQIPAASATARTSAAVQAPVAQTQVSQAPAAEAPAAQVPVAPTAVAQTPIIEAAMLMPPLPSRAPVLLKKTSVTPRPASAGRTARRPAVKRKRPPFSPFSVAPHEAGSEH